MNDWSRLAVDPNTMQKLRRRKANCTNTKCAPDTATGRGLSGRRVRANKSVPWEDRQGQLRLSLTNTYHEWPVNAVSRALGR
jgi:hypothetical protein